MPFAPRFKHALMIYGMSLNEEDGRTSGIGRLENCMYATDAVPRSPVVISWQAAPTSLVLTFKMCSTAETDGRPLTYTIRYYNVYNQNDGN